MRIAFDHQIFGWQEYGGISRYIYELACELATDCHQDVSIVSPVYVNKYLEQAPGSVRIFGRPIHPIPRTGRILRALNSPLVWSLLKKLQPDIVHETYYAMLRLAPKGARTVLTVHDMIHERFPDAFMSSALVWREKRAALARADHVICVSRQTQRDLVEISGIDPAKTTVVHHGLTLTDVVPEECEETQNRPYLLYVGNRSGYKNHEGMLRAVATSSFLRKEFRIVCFGGGVFSNREKTLIADLGFSDMDICQLSGPDGMLAGLYRRASAFVYPSMYEGFGIPPLEAMSHGCPVACSNVSSIPEVVGDAGAYFSPTDIDGMRATIEHLVTDESYRSRLIDAGHRRAAEFSWARCARETQDVYQRVLAERS